MGKRLKLGGGGLLLAIGLWGIAWWTDPEAGSALMTLRVTTYALVGALGVVGLSVLLFGKIGLIGLLSIDLRGEQPVFRVGPWFLCVVVRSTWQRGAQRLGRDDLYLVVPWLVRVIAIGVLAAWAYGLARSVWDFGTSCLVAGGAFIGLYVLQGLWRGSPDPNAVPPPAVSEPESKA